MNVHIPQTFSCPCCGGLIGQAATIDEVRKAVTAPALRIIFDSLSRNVGQAVPRNRIADLLWGGRSDGGPETGYRNLAVQVSQLRRKIEPFGWTINRSLGGSGNHSSWRLIPTEASA